MSKAGPRRIILCADDYGFAPGVNRAIRDLIEAKRINATSVMVTGPAISRHEAEALKASTSSHSACAIGLHVTLTAPLQPLTAHFKPLAGEAFLPMPALLRAALLRKLDRSALFAELQAQLSAFRSLFGREPDYVDGHQHVQLFPQIRDAFVTAVKQDAPQAWVRQCGRSPTARRGTSPKALLLDGLSRTFRQRCTATGVSFNPGFAGAYDMVRGADYGSAFSGFLDGLPDGGVVMCHPGFVDDTLRRIDNVTDQREREFAFFKSDDFLATLRSAEVILT